MTPEVIVFGAGAALILVAILGGGVELKELKLPQLAAPARAFAMIVGIAFVALGVWMKAPPPSTVSSAFAPSPPSSPSTLVQVSNPPQKAETPKPAEPVPTVQENLIRFRVTDTLGADQVREEIELSIDGKKIGVFSISESNRSESLVVTLQARNSFAYRLWGHAWHKVPGAQPRKLLVSGSGVFSANDGDTFKLFMVKATPDDLTTEIRKTAD